MTTIDWTAIRAGYESGISQNTLAKLHFVSRQAISKRAKKEGWITTLVAPPVMFVTPPVTPLSSPIDEQSEADIVQKALRHLATYLEGEGLASLNQHKLFADSLSQYIKLKLLMPSDKPTASGISSDLLPYLDLSQLDELAQLQSKQEDILEEAKARKLETEQGIMSIKATKRTR